MCDCWVFVAYFLQKGGVHLRIDMNWILGHFVAQYSAGKALMPRDNSRSLRGKLLRRGYRGRWLWMLLEVQMSATASRWSDLERE